MYTAKQVAKKKTPRALETYSDFLFSKKMMTLVAGAALTKAVHEQTQQKNNSNTKDFVVRCINAAPIKSGSIQQQLEDMFSFKIKIHDKLVFESVAVIYQKQYITIMNQELFRFFQQQKINDVKILKKYCTYSFLKLPINFPKIQQNHNIFTVDVHDLQNKTQVTQCPDNFLQIYFNDYPFSS